MAPYVSVLIDTYNHERYIEEAITSVLGQDFPRSEFEVLVVDDGSTDRTTEIVRKFGSRVRLLTKKNGGQASAINFVTARAIGSVVAFLDGDDVWLPNKLSRVVREFETELRPVMVYHGYCFYNAAEDWTWLPDYFAAVSGDILGDQRKLLTYSAAPTSSLAFRLATLKRLMPVPEECSFMHDIYLLGTAICLGPVAGIDECLTRNRVHGQNLCFAERGEPRPEVLRRRVDAWDAAIRSIRTWSEANNSAATRAKLKVLIKRWEMVREQDRFGFERPGRLRYAGHLWRYAWTYTPVLKQGDLAYRCAYALGALVLGYEHAHYMEGVRTRAQRLVRYSNRRAERAEDSQPTGTWTPK
jgi:glycosyltransferase involved in cell wall biosynthesis